MDAEQTPKNCLWSTKRRHEPSRSLSVALLLLMFARPWRPLLAAVCCMVLLSASGCHREGSELVPVRGMITFGGGSWPKPGILYFTAESSAPGLPKRPALGGFDTEGKLTVSTAEKGDGLVPGKYRIAVECWEVPPQMGTSPSPKSYVPMRYTSAATSGLTVTVEPGQKVVTLNLDVTKK